MMINSIGLSGNLWPIHLKPLRGEILSSWIVRIAHAHGLKLHTFCALVFGRNKQIWNRDIDKLAPEWLLAKLSEATGTPISDVLATTLKSYESILYETHQSNANLKWINPLGIYHRLHQWPGLQYCPLCLRLDNEPYYRKTWRLAFFTVCNEHHILMHDRCPKCESTINFHRIEMGKKQKIKPIAAFFCFKCGCDLRNSPTQRVECNDWQVTISYRTILDLHDMGWVVSDKLTLQYSPQYFEVVRHLCGLMISNRRANKMFFEVANKLGLNLKSQLFSKSTAFEKRSIFERHVLLICCMWILLDWPNRFVGLCKSYKLSSAYLIKDFVKPPFWYYSVLSEQLNEGQYSPNEFEIQSAKNYLKKNGKEAGITAVSRLLGFSTLKKKGNI